MRPIAASILLLVVFAPTVRAQAPELLVEVDRDRVYVGDSFRYRVTLNNVDSDGAGIPSEPALTGFGDFDMQPLGQSSLNSQNLTIINGRATRVIRRGRQYDYRLTPTKSGRLTVPAPTIEIDGKTVEGSQVVITVTAPQEQDIALLETSVDHESVYPMQPFRVTLDVFVRDLPGRYSARDPLGVQQSPPALSIPWAQDDQLPAGVEPDVDWQGWLGPMQDRRGAGFGINGIGQDSVFALFEARKSAFHPAPEKKLRADADGKETGYWRYRFTRTFTARESGPISFGPVTLKGTFATEMNRQGQLTGEDIFAVAPTRIVLVKPVPEEGKPSNYIGAVGNFELDAELAPSEVQVGAPMTLTLTLRGEGTVESAIAPDLARQPDISSRFRTYEATAETISDTRRFTYALRPLNAGAEPFPSIPISYFDVDEERYVTIRSDPIPLEVVEATHLSNADIVAAANGGSSASRAIETSAEGIFANVTNLGAVRDESVRPGRWLTAASALAVCYGLVVMLVGRAKRLSSDPALLRRRSASGLVRKALREARSVIERDGPKEAAERVRVALTGLIADVADADAAGLTPRDARERLDGLGVEKELASQAERVLEACDAARYGASDRVARDLLVDAESVTEALLRSFDSRRMLR